MSKALDIAPDWQWWENLSLLWQLASRESLLTKFGNRVVYEAASKWNAKVSSFIWQGSWFCLARSKEMVRIQVGYHSYPFSRRILWHGKSQRMVNFHALQSGIKYGWSMISWTGWIWYDINMQSFHLLAGCQGQISYVC